MVPDRLACGLRPYPWPEAEVVVSGLPPPGQPFPKPSWRERRRLDALQGHLPLPAARHGGAPRIGGGLPSEDRITVPSLHPPPPACKGKPRKKGRAPMPQLEHVDAIAGGRCGLGEWRRLRGRRQLRRRGAVRRCGGPATVPLPEDGGRSAGVVARCPVAVKAVRGSRRGRVQQ